MEQTLHDLSEILLRAIPTIIILVLLHNFLKAVLFGPMEKMLKQRGELTHGARHAAEASLANAERKTADYEAKLREGFWGYLPLAAGVGILLALEMGAVLWTFYSRGAVEAPEYPAGYSNTRELGRLLYTDYVYPFEIAAVILLVAIVAAIALTLRRRSLNKNVDPAEQVKVHSRDRVRVVKMKAEPKQT